MKRFPDSGIFLIKNMIIARTVAPKIATNIENPILNPIGNASYEYKLIIEKLSIIHRVDISRDTSIR